MIKLCCLVFGTHMVLIVSTECLHDNEHDYAMTHSTLHQGLAAIYVSLAWLVMSIEHSEVQLTLTAYDCQSILNT